MPYKAFPDRTLALLKIAPFFSCCFLSLSLLSISPSFFFLLGKIQSVNSGKFFLRLLFTSGFSLKSDKNWSVFKNIWVSNFFFIIIIFFAVIEINLDQRRQSKNFQKKSLKWKNNSNIFWRLINSKWTLQYWDNVRIFRKKFTSFDFLGKMKLNLLKIKIHGKACAQNKKKKQTNFQY